jgi:hypothetical protein
LSIGWIDMVGRQDHDNLQPQSIDADAPRAGVRKDPQMPWKYLALIVFGVVVGATAMSIRQHRLETSHEMVRLFRQINQHRQSLWALQARIANNIDPTSLHQAIERAQLDLEPWTTPPEADRTSLAAVEAPHGRR